jgi:redox-sensitive bicupin YhaK (pirin superfamily)
MITVRPSAERGHFDHGWLDTYHTFSFAGYMDLRHMGFRSLRVINEDRVAPGQGFGTHPHSDMEIITVVLSGALEHKDSMGNGSVIRPGEVQRMTAGTGVTHSEFNQSEKDPVHLIQIWILPERAGLTPSYEQKAISRKGGDARIQLLVSPDGRNGSLTLHQDAFLYGGKLEKGSSISHELEPGRAGWIQVTRGDLAVNGVTLSEGDGARVVSESELVFSSEEGAEFLLFDLA